MCPVALGPMTLLSLRSWPTTQTNYNGTQLSTTNPPWSHLFIIRPPRTPIPPHVARVQASIFRLFVQLHLGRASEKQPFACLGSQILKPNAWRPTAVIAWKKPSILTNMVSCLADVKGLGFRALGLESLHNSTLSALNPLPASLNINGSACRRRSTQ